MCSGRDGAADDQGREWIMAFQLRAVLSAIVMMAAVLIVPRGAAWCHDLEEIKARGVLQHLGVPYANFVTGSGDGMEVELMQLFARRLGVNYEYVRTDWDDCIGDLTGKRVRLNGGAAEVLADVPVRGDVIANGMTVLPWREQVIAFSAPVFQNQVWLIARADSPLRPIKPSGSIDKDIAAVKQLLRDRSLLCKANTCLDPALYQLDATGARTLLYTGQLNELVPALLNRKAELTILDVPDALVALQKWPGKIKVIGPISGMQAMAAGFRKDSPKLRAAFDAFLGELKENGTFQVIVRKYYPYILDYYPRFFEER